ncbi:MAG: L-arabinose isomerase, partial [Oscillospiraceae bacterium]|nr:L-arabinose isomerase [Oscillospiraceae bacterium]
MRDYEFWFIVGSQHLYGGEVLETVAARAAEMAAYLDGALPFRVVCKGVVKTPDEASALAAAANNDAGCAGVIAWMHTFSPSKMWINGLVSLRKPYCHLHTQYNREIPDELIDMEFMNLNQSAHGDREHGYIAARLRMARKVVVGYWRDADVRGRLDAWARAAAGAAVSRELKVVRFGDNMRQVAVTEGDKVEAQIKFGWQVNTWPVGHLTETLESVTEAEVGAALDEYRALYSFDTEDIEPVRYQAREELAIERILNEQGAGA